MPSYITLTKLALGYEPPETISGQIFPTITVEGSPIEIKKFGKELFKRYMTRRGMFAASNVAKTNRPDYIYVKLEPRDFVVEFDREHEPTNEQPDKEHMTKEAKGAVFLDVEADNGERLLNPENFPTGNKSLLSGTDKFTDFVNSQPLEVVDAGKDVIADKIGKEPNLMVIPKNVLTRIIRHPQLEIKSLTGQITAATVEYLKERFQIENILIGRSLKLNESTNEFVPIWSTHIALMYRNPNPNPSVREMSFGYRLQQKGYPFIDDDIEGIDKKKIEAVRYNDKFEDVVLCAEAGYLIQNAI